MQLENITYEDSKFNLLPNRYQDTNAIAIMILADETELVGTLFEYGLIKAREWVQVDFFEGVYFYEPTQELINYLDELKEKYNK